MKSDIGVSTNPGQSAVTRTPSSNSSSDSDRDRPTTACLVAA